MSRGALRPIPMRRRHGLNESLNAPGDATPSGPHQPKEGR
jgi:hypothetical protein